MDLYIKKESKTCSMCKKELPVSFFFLHTINRDGLRYECKECSREKKRLYKEKVKFLKLHPELKPKEGHKICTRCKEEKPFSNYTPSKNSKGCLRAQCKECIAELTYSRVHKHDPISIRNRNNAARLRKEFPEKYAMKGRVAAMKSRGVNITEEQYLELVKESDGLCEICKQPNDSTTKKNLSVDHCHKTGKVRGLLCDRCNRAIGMLEDNPELLLKAADYLMIHQVDLSSILDIGI